MPAPKLARQFFAEGTSLQCRDAWNLRQRLQHGAPRLPPTRDPFAIGAASLYEYDLDRSRRTIAGILDAIDWDKVQAMDCDWDYDAIDWHNMPPDDGRDDGDGDDVTPRRPLILA
jgi:hypothetical protein